MAKNTKKLAALIGRESGKGERREDEREKKPVFGRGGDGGVHPDEGADKGDPDPKE
jgi:hypothetical protein